MSVFIPKHLFPAVMFAKKMIREGESPQLAIYKAAQYYDVETSDVASYVGRKHNAKSGYVYAVVFAIGDEDDFNSPCGMKRYCRIHDRIIEKTISRKSFESKIAKKIWKEQCDSDDFFDRNPEYAPVYKYVISKKMYETKEETEKQMESLISETMRKWNEEDGEAG